MLVAVIVWLAGIVVSDLARRRVPNLWVAAGAVLALVALLAGQSPLGIDWKAALSAAAIGFTALLACYALGLMGAGDVKFVGALGLWFGGLAMVPIAIAASLLAGLHAVGWLLWQRRPGKARPIARPARSRWQSRPIPYAGYLALAALGWLALHLHRMPA